MTLYLWRRIFGIQLSWQILLVSLNVLNVLHMLRLGQVLINFAIPKLTKLFQILQTVTYTSAAMDTEIPRQLHGSQMMMHLVVI